MEFKNNNKNIIFFHVFSPTFLIFSLIIYLLTPKNKVTFFIVAAIIIYDFFSNVHTLFKTYNNIQLNKNSLVITKGIFNKKIHKIPYKKIKSIELIGYRLPGYKSTNAIIPINGLFYNPERDKFKIYQGHIDDLEFERFENELRRRIKNAR